MQPTPSRTLFRSPLVAIGRFSIGVDHPDFDTAGQMTAPEFVFPRTAIWIEHADRPRFLADPTVATLYNGGTAYRRQALSPQGDRCDWFRVAPEALREIAARHDPRAASRDGVFDVPWHRVTARSYARQRALVHRLRESTPETPTLDALHVEAEALALAHELLAPTDGERPAAPGERSRASARAGVAEACRAVLLAPGRRWTLADLGEVAGLTPFQLLRAFKRWTGSPVHTWVLDLRLRLSLERVAAGEDLATVALDLGFASHSHYTTAFGAAFGAVPSAFRSRVASDARPPRPAARFRKRESRLPA